MARKAVQGYTEKSYYDNTKYLGMVATNDPTQEGYFAHMVNFDISDTGQSVMPRRGILTTTLVNKLSQNVQLISLSSQTIAFRENNIGAHILFDLPDNKGYIADITAYNVDNKLLPITNLITNIDWSDVVSFVKREVPDFVTYEAQLRVTYPTATDETIYGMLLTYIRTNIKLYAQHKVEYALDKSGIRKTLIKVVLQDNDILLGGNPFMDLPFVLELYYREKANDYPTGAVGELSGGNTLIMSVVDTEEHLTYDPNSRNIASSKSIIPVVSANDPTKRIKQILYTESNRPVGMLSTVGLAMYAKGSDNRFFNLYIKRSDDFTLVPYYELDAATLMLNNPDARWAYRVEVTSKKRFNNVSEQVGAQLYFKTPWFKLVDKTTMPTEVFPRFKNVTDLSNSLLSSRHYKEARVIITLVPRINTKAETFAEYDTLTNVITRGAVPTSAEINKAVNEYHTPWLTKIASLKTPSQFAKQIRESFSGTVLERIWSFTLFHVQFINDTPLSGGSYGNLQTDIDLASYGSNTPLQEYNYSEVGSLTDSLSSSVFIDSDAMIRLIESGAFTDKHIVFKLLPFRFKNTLTTYTDSSYVSTRYEYKFTQMNYWNTFSYAPTLLTYMYNLYNDQSTETFASLQSNGTYDILINKNTLNNSVNLPFVHEQPEYHEFFTEGYLVTVYMRPYTDAEITGKTFGDLELMKTAWMGTPYKAIANLQYGFDDLTVTKIVEKLSREPRDIKWSLNYTVFNDSRLVVWHNNQVYISEAGNYNYFKEAMRKEYPERVVKVLPYKNILLVFTVQNLYAIYEVAFQTVDNDDKGAVVPVDTTAWASTPVLYNIMTHDKYADVIQVFNQMVLFYSADGQMFMIKPSTTIDSETRFTLQYFNKSANDILENFEVYINKRLVDYGIKRVIAKEDVEIKALVSINFIKLFYSVPGLITYMLVYDVINNRYYSYDTLTFTKLNDKMYVDSGELYLTVSNNKTYISFDYVEPNTKDSNVDMTFEENFKRHAINSIIDTGNLNLNNHLRKRFRDLHLTFKNLSASNLMFNLETRIDDVISQALDSTVLEVITVGDRERFVQNVVSNAVELTKEDNSVVFDLSKFNSSKLLQYTTSILGVGKVFGFKLVFVSKGVYKLQDFGIIYKERRI